MTERIREAVLRDIRQYGRVAVAAVGIWAAMTVLIGHTCVARLLFGLPCPWCGMTRALGFMLTGHFAESWQMHPMAVFYVLLGVLFLVFRYAGRLRFVFYPALIAVFAATVVLYIVRFPELFPGIPPFDYVPNNLFALLFLR